MSNATELVSEISSKIGNAAKVVALRASRRLSQGGQVRPGFFDSYPQFFETSETTAFANRLNERHRAIIDVNQSAIAGKRVLDIASHDGRWSFAALQAGAAHVMGIEARAHLVQSAGENLQRAGIARDQFQFIQGDAFKALDQVAPGQIDTVMCLGFFYHVTDHMALLSQVERLKPQHIIIDTAVAADPRNIVLWQVENHDFESDAFRTSDAQKVVLAGIPSKPALDLMLSSFGWKSQYHDWKNAGIRNWTHIEDYQEGTRVTLRVDVGG
jgi:2-polyprenyl-3-methyl-5-hydroxy-6-metoxy-1,4-benzoquinol methylase